MAQGERCGWAKTELDIAYHDTEWGTPEHSDEKLFEFLLLEGMQAGLSWNLILKRRESMRAAF
ncbi:MAG: DNA-3-methyladenine glycosylase I, partial [Oscillospiraceae bacterium]